MNSESPFRSMTVDCLAASPVAVEQLQLEAPTEKGSNNTVGAYIRASTRTRTGTRSQNLHATVFDNQQATHSAVFDYIEVFYNRKRKHMSIGGLSPVQFEACTMVALAA